MTEENIIQTEFHKTSKNGCFFEKKGCLGALLNEFYKTFVNCYFYS